MNFASWPFISPANRLPVEEERWRETCYLPSAVQSLAEGYSQECLILGGYQSGCFALLTFPFVNNASEEPEPHTCYIHARRKRISPYTQL